MSSAPQPPSPSAQESSRRIASELCRTMAAIHRRGWCDGTGGNFSVVLQRSPDLRLLMAPSGVDKGRLRPAELIVVDGGGAVVSGEGRVSAEMALHRTIVLDRGAGAVLHTHSQAATLLSRQAMGPWPSPAPRGSGGPGDVTSDEATSGAVREAPLGLAQGDCAHVEIAGLEMLKGLAGIQTHESRIQIPVLANDQDLMRLSDAVRPTLKTAPHGVLIAGHGLYAWGVSLAEATRHLEILEFLLEQRWRQLLLKAIFANPS